MRRPRLFLFLRKLLIIINIKQLISNKTILKINILKIHFSISIWQNPNNIILYNRAMGSVCVFLRYNCYNRYSNDAF